MQNTTTPPNDQWLIDKYKGKGQVLAFNKVYFELIDLFGKLNIELNSQSPNGQTITELSRKIASIVNNVKFIIESKQDKSLIHRANEFSQHIRTLMGDITSGMQTSIQSGQFNKQINNITEDAESLMDMQLTYHDYANDISGALMAEERPQIQLSIEHTNSRKDLNKRQRVKYFDTDGSQAFKVRGNVDKQTLGKYFVLSQQRSVGTDRFMGTEEAKNREQIFHHYVGLCMLCQIAEQDYADKTITLPNGKTVTVAQYIDAFIDPDMLRVFTEICIDNVIGRPNAADANKAITTFEQTYIDHIYTIILAIFS